MAGKPNWAHDESPQPKWGTPQFPSPIVPEYMTGDGAVGAGNSPLAPHNNDRASRIPDRQPEKTAFHRGRIESDGARLSISPSAKIPQNDPASGMTQSNTRIVKSRAQGRAAFDEGTHF